MATSGLMMGAPTAFASTVASAAFTGGAGTVSVGGALYAKSGGALTLTVTTSSDTQCVDVAGAFTGHQTSGTAESSWTFTTSAGSGDGAQTVTASASPGFNPHGDCTGKTTTGQALYTLDNTGPALTAALSPAANAAGWNNSSVNVTWSAIDAGSRVGSGPTPASSTESTDGIVTRTSTATDRLGNVGNGSITVRVDKAAPTITAAQAKNLDGTTTVTFTCSDDSGSGITSCLADGSLTNAKTVQPGTTVGGTANDTAGNVATTSVTVAAGDTSAPTLSGTPTTLPNPKGWYSGDVTVHWTATDLESGIPTPPSDTTITGENTGLTSTTTVTNGAGLSTVATSSPAVKIDRTPPSTGISGTSNSWTNGAVAVSLSATDNLSPTIVTEYSVDGNPVQTGTSFSLATDGDHTVTFFSTDEAGNAEAAQTVHVKIDTEAPAISHAFNPLTYIDGAWTNQDVTVTFSCTDLGGSLVADCTTPPVTKSAEGVYIVLGTATDGAGNSATDSASVRIDKTVPTITAAAGGSKNAAGWYKADVVVGFTCVDPALADGTAGSGVASCTLPEKLGEGANQSASGTAADTAGNTASDGVTGINIDKTKPSLTGTFSSGWHTGDVTVSWLCTDDLSGPAGQPTNTKVDGEGANLSSTTSCEDMAGNSVTKTVTGIKIDRTAPTTTSSVADPLISGWYGNAVQVTLNGHDNLSGIASTQYTVDGGTPQNYAGAFMFGADGTHTIAFWSKDGAGNVETAGVPLTLKIDTTPPTTTVVKPISPDTGWFVTSGIPVAFDANDDGGAGILATYYTIDDSDVQTYGKPFTADLSTGTHTITYWSVDLADNVEAHATTNTIAVNVDTNAPTITGKATPVANAFGWNNTGVDVKFTCEDIGSGLQTDVAGCAGDTTLTNDGGGQTVHGDAVDVAGNRSGTDVTGINIDTTKPTLSGAPTTEANADGWYKGDVSIVWAGVDKLSDINPATQPANSTVTGEGRNLGAGPVTIADKAGNVSVPASVTGVNIDRKAPVVTGVLPAGSNTAGWYKGNVVVGFTCLDPALADGTAGSGVANCPSDVMLSGDGLNQFVTSAAATDIAGNISDFASVTGINIDGHAPQTIADNKCTAINGYCKGSSAAVVLSSTDIGPAGVKEIHYSVNGGDVQIAQGASTTLSIPTETTGNATFTYFAVDNAGNVEPPNHGTLNYDNIAPTVTHTVSPAANAAHWNNSNVTVHFTAKDTDPGSGVVASSITLDVTISSETTTDGTLVEGSAKDTADNVGTDAVTVRLDKTAPSITGVIMPGTTMVNGWYTGSVRVHFTCSDALSGLGVCPDDVTMTSNGANQSVTRTATDIAGNSANATVAGITIDNENPTVTSVNVANGSYTLGAVPAATCKATDSFSGVASCKVTVTGGNASGVGTFNYVATATDNAGNASAPLSGTYAVIYRFDGFLQPINDTAHEDPGQVPGTSLTSIFKAGSTVPAKFQLKNSVGAAVQATSAPVWLTPAKGNAMSDPVDESSYGGFADIGVSYRYDATAAQYIYNWKTGSGGNYWRIGVRFDDGQTYYVNIGLR